MSVEMSKMLRIVILGPLYSIAWTYSSVRYGDFPYARCSSRTGG